MKRLLAFTTLTGLLFTLTASPVATSALTMDNSSDNTIINTNQDVVNNGDTIVNTGTSQDAANNSSTITIIPSDPSAYASLFVNDAKIAYVEYGGSVNMRWESSRMSSCVLNPTGQSGKNGQSELQNITSNMRVTIACVTNSGVQYIASGRSRDVTVDIKVKPPTFSYLKGYLAQIQSGGNKKVNLSSTLVMIDQAQKAYGADKPEAAMAFLQKSVNNLKQQSKQGTLNSDQLNQYERAAIYLGKTLTVSLTLAEDGCSIASSGPAGLTLQYGSHELGLSGDIFAILGVGPNYPIILGYQSRVDIPTDGVITASIPSRSGWTAFGVVTDSDGLIYAVKTVEVASSCL